MDDFYIYDFEDDELLQDYRSSTRGDREVQAVVLRIEATTQLAWLMRVILPLGDDRVLECEHWMPKSRCRQTGTDTLAVPQWLVDRIAAEHEPEIQYGVPNDRVVPLVGRRPPLVGEW